MAQSSLALSTMWMQNRADTLIEFAEQAADAGYAQVEVSHIVTPDMLTGWKPGRVVIPSVHYPAPVLPSPYGRPADVLINSLDEPERAWAVEQGRHSIQFAAQAGAKALCIHLGAVASANPRLEWVLRQRYLGGEAGRPTDRSLKSQAYELTQAALVAERAEHAAPYLAAARRSLEELAAEAGRLGVQLGLETRYFYVEIPSFSEFTALRSGLEDVVGLWLDTGHAQALAELGFEAPQDWAQAYGRTATGVHLHDCRGLRDHLLPGLGSVDFAAVLSHISPTAVFTAELDWYYTAREIRLAKDSLDSFLSLVR